MLFSSSLVKANIVSASSILASFNISSSKASPLITIEDESSFAISSALCLFFSIILTLASSKLASNNLARFNPILPPPIMIKFLDTFSSWPKAFRI
jgi:hypothetical protein